MLDSNPGPLPLKSGALSMNEEYKVDASDEKYIVMTILQKIQRFNAKYCVISENSLN